VTLATLAARSPLHPPRATTCLDQRAHFGWKEGIDAINFPLLDSIRRVREPLTVPMMFKTNWRLRQPQHRPVTYYSRSCPRETRICQEQLKAIRERSHASSQPILRKGVLACYLRCVAMSFAWTGAEQVMSPEFHRLFLHTIF